MMTKIIHRELINGRAVSAQRLHRAPADALDIPELLRQGPCVLVQVWSGDRRQGAPVRETVMPSGRYWLDLAGAARDAVAEMGE